MAIVIDIFHELPVFKDLSTVIIETALLNRSLDGSVEYTADLQKQFELTKADLYMEMATAPDYSEGQLSVDYDSDKLEEMANLIYDEYNDPKSRKNRMGRIGARKVW